MKKILFFLFCVFNAGLAYSATEMSDVYLLAQTRNASELGKLENIDVVDKNGDTALCSAIKNGNIDAYNLLKNAGASVDHKCVKKIPTSQYEHFVSKVAVTDKPWSFLGLGKLAWGAIGAGVVAGGAAASMGGGGDTGTQGDQFVPDPESLLSCQERGFTYTQSDVCPEGW